jgi:hypothetical protein
MRTLALFLALAASVNAGCSKQTTADAVAPAAQAAVAQPAAAAQDPAAPVTAAAAPAGQPQSFTGTVVETMDAASYTYVRVKTPEGDIWAASGQFKVAVGDTVVVPIETPMQDFSSPSLKRTFKVIYFASRILKEGESAPAAMPAMPALAPAHGGGAAPAGAMGGMMGGMMGAPKAAPVVQKMAPPDGGVSVADVWAKRTTLAGKTVIVRGTVVKFNSAILGRNWIHIQDGSGKADDGTHDLTLTSDAVVKVGDVVTMTGVVAVDKDFTAGYAYPVMVENAKLK